MGKVDFSKLMKSNDVLLSFGLSIRAAARIEGAFTGTRGSLLISAPRCNQNKLYLCKRSKRRRN